MYDLNLHILIKLRRLLFNINIGLYYTTLVILGLPVLSHLTQLVRSIMCTVYPGFFAVLSYIYAVGLLSAKIT